MPKIMRNEQSYVNRFYYIFQCKTAYPQGEANFDTRDIIWDTIWAILIEIHQNKLHVKYLSSSACGLVQQYFLRFHYIFLCETADPLGGAHFDSRDIIWAILVGVYNTILHTKYILTLELAVWDKKFLKSCLIYLHFKHMTPGAGPILTQGT